MLLVVGCRAVILEKFAFLTPEIICSSKNWSYILLRVNFFFNNDKSPQPVAENCSFATRNMFQEKDVSNFEEYFQHPMTPL